MGASPVLALPWPELPVQADGPAAFQALATATENKMSNLVASGSWNGDLTSSVPPGTQVTIFSQDVAVVVNGWAWIDINIGIAVAGPAGAGIPIQNAGGYIFIQQNTTALRTLRWHSRSRAEMFWVSGGCALALPPSVNLAQVRIVMATDGSGQTGFAYEYNVGVTQFGASRG